MLPTRAERQRFAALVAESFAAAGFEVRILYRGEQWLLIITRETLLRELLVSVEQVLRFRLGMAAFVQCLVVRTLAEVRAFNAGDDQESPPSGKTPPDLLR
jgi:hypothetical protein